MCVKHYMKFFVELYKLSNNCYWLFQATPMTVVTLHLTLYFPKKNDPILLKGESLILSRF